MIIKLNVWYLDRSTVDPYYYFITSIRAHSGGCLPTNFYWSLSNNVLVFHDGAETNFTENFSKEKTPKLTNWQKKLMIYDVFTLKIRMTELMGDDRLD